MAKLTDLVSALGDSIGLPNWAAEPSGAYVVVFDGNLEIELLPLTAAIFVLRYRVCDLLADPQEAEATMRKALQRNLTQLHGQAATLARDSETGKLWLYRTGDANQLTTATIGEFFEQFVNAADQWSRFDAGSSGGAFPAAGFPFPMLRP